MDWKKRSIKFSALKNEDCFAYPGIETLRFLLGNGNLFKKIIPY